MEIEIFTSVRCPSCTWAVETVGTVAAEFGEAVTWRTRDVVEDLDRAVSLGVRATPAIVVDGELLTTGTPKAAQLRAAIRQRLEVTPARGDNDELSDR